MGFSALVLIMVLVFCCTSAGKKHDKHIPMNDKHRKHKSETSRGRRHRNPDVEQVLQPLLLEEQRRSKRHVPPKPPPPDFF